MHIRKVDSSFDIFTPDIDRTAICVTTNGIVKKDGKAVMGAGVAKEARDRFDGIDSSLGQTLKRYGNHVHNIARFTTSDGKRASILSFPTKHHWKNPSDITLIEQSARELIKTTNRCNYQEVRLTPPGCGCGGLKWADTKPILEPILDDRFVVILRQ